ncbi:MAG: LacI family DNA-binding transcriptional regulator [Oscillospiraceae bacterium]|nr:LacI family DNA-binding transcriptional regulator [Oscillospiraceae bacterium]
MTIKDVAKSCGVSVSTVSRVLNQHPDVSEEVRQRVLDEVERCGYIPNNSARDLVKSRSDAIGVVVRGTGNLFFSAVLKTVSEEIERYGYTMVLHYIGSDADEVKAGAILEREKKLQGLLFLGGRFDYTPSELSVIGIPFVCCSYTNYFGNLDEKDYSSVSIDDYATAYNAVTELIRRGHRRIAAVVPSKDDRSISELRYRGFLAALKDSGLEADESLIEETGGCFEMPDTYEGVCRLLDRTKDFTALFLLSDTTAMAAMKALEDRGRRIPQDVSVIAIDGLNVSEYAIPTLTTMIQPAEEMGRESVRILMNMLKDPSYTGHRLLAAPLREGASVRSI